MKYKKISGYVGIRKNLSSSMYEVSKKIKGRTFSKTFKTVKEVTDLAIENGYTVYGLSASYIDDLKVLNQNENLNFDWLFVDGTVLKTIIRANPGILTLENGTVTGKWNWIDADDFKP